LSIQPAMSESQQGRRVLTTVRSILTQSYEGAMTT
jgi:hypothetical protein